MAVIARDDFSIEKPATSIDRLRRKLRRVEATASLTGYCCPSYALGIASIDRLLGGGLACGALHEIAATRENHLPAATGFALALTIRAVKKAGQPSNQNLSRPPATAVIWIVEDLSLVENGALYGPGLEDTGISPDRLITVTAARGRDVLWAMEEALRCRAVGMVIGEMRSPAIDPVATRRLSHTAAATGALGLLLRSAPDDAPSAATTRWIIGAVSSCEPGIERRGLGPPRLSARLVRNRRGLLGSWILEWNSVQQRFEVPTHSQPVAGAALDRPHRAAVG
jgi:protein ImuA